MKKSDIYYAIALIVTVSFVGYFTYDIGKFDGNLNSYKKDEQIYKEGCKNGKADFSLSKVKVDTLNDSTLIIKIRK